MCWFVIFYDGIKLNSRSGNCRKFTGMEETNTLIGLF
jgi:hypothetical protein